MRGHKFVPVFLRGFIMLNYILFRKVVAPEYASMIDAELDVFATEAEIEISETKWGARYPRGVALLTAHLIKVAPSNSSESSAVGILNKTKVGNLERGYATKSDPSGYDRTSYGVEFLRLRKQVLMGPVMLDNRC